MAQYKVMVPLDGSRLAEHSLVYLDALRSVGESKVLLLSVVDEAEDFRALDPNEALAREENILATYLREVAADIKQHLGIEVETRVVAGSPAASILEEAANYSPDLLVISTHGRSGISRWRLGSVADKVIRGAVCNTLVVGPKAAERGTWIDARIMEPFKSLLVPLDGSGLAETALPMACTFAESYGAEIHLVRVVQVPTTTADGMGEISYMPDLLDTLIDSARVYLRNTSKKLDRPDLKTDVLVGGTAWQLEDYVARNAIDLVIMTSHGRGGFVRTALGSVTDRLLGGAAPVLVVRPQE
jgi:nucleotide-binding universal stress UspA family protein